MNKKGFIVFILHLCLLNACSNRVDGQQNLKSQRINYRQNLLPLDPKHYSKMEVLGSRIFTDTRLSSPEGQACVSCHSPKVAFSDARRELPVSKGAFDTHFGSRNAPMAMYGKWVPPLHLQTEEDGSQIYAGGLFLDGRVQSLSEQAQAPFLNPLEMGATKEHVVSQVCTSPEYGSLFRKVFGSQACPQGEWTEAQISKSFLLVADAIASFESILAFSPFSSKFDRVMAHQDEFTTMERLGFEIFENEDRGNCAACHTLDTNNRARQAMLTDFTYDNLGIPAKPIFPELGHNEKDLGLANTTGRKQDRGLFRVPSLRNVALTAPYGHNGYFKTLKQVIDFYGTRDLKPVCKGQLSVEEAEIQNCWPRPEIPETVNHDELGKLDFSPLETQALIEFLLTLTDN